VDQLAGTGAFIADRGGLRRPDHLAGQRITLSESWHLVATQDPGHGAGCHSELGTEPVLPATVFSTSRQDAFLDRR
jgi:hypothetical protein